MIRMLATNKWELSTVITGSFTARALSAVQSYTNGSTHKLTVQAIGSVVKIFIDDVQILTFTNSFNATATGMAIGNGAVNTTLFTLLRVNAAANVNIVFDGGSLTGGFGGSNSPTTSYPNQCMLKLYSMGAQGGNNLGVGGLTVENLVSRFSATVAPLFVSGMRNIICFFEASNSLNPDGQNDTPAQQYAAMTTYIGLAHAAGFELVLLTGLVQNGIGHDPITAYNILVRANTGGADAIADVGAKPEFLDPTDSRYFYSDDVHLVDLGYFTIAGYVDPVALSLWP